MGESCTTGMRFIFLGGLKIQPTKKALGLVLPEKNKKDRVSEPTYSTPGLLTSMEGWRRGTVWLPACRPPFAWRWRDASGSPLFLLVWFPHPSQLTQTNDGVLLSALHLSSMHKISQLWRYRST